MDFSQPGMDEIKDAIAQQQSGDVYGGREQLLKLWNQWSAVDGSALQCCTIAHFLADTEQQIEAELEWDLRALEAVTGARDSEDRDPLAPDFEGLLPSLHLNVGDAYLRSHDIDRAQRHAEIGLTRATSLTDDPYGELIRRGLQHLLASARAT